MKYHHLKVHVFNAQIFRRHADRTGPCDTLYNILPKLQQIS
jgi:hypothetical protein